MLTVWLDEFAAIIALNEDQDAVRHTAEIYRKRRDTVIDGLKRIGGEVEEPRATMSVWAEIPGPFKKMGSIDQKVFEMRWR